MKCACVFLFCFVYVTVTVSARGYSARMYNPLKATAPLNYVFEDSEQLVEYIDPRTPEIQRRLKAADKISSLPGQPAVRFSQYSGYVTVDPSAGRSLFYYFTESVRPSDKPLLLWLNGGPGCSSLGSGAYTELGPFRVNPDGKTLWHNKYAWNNVANVIFLESPAGVGFSYSNRSKDYYTGDKKTAADTHTFLLNWLSRFPEYENRDFYISGESYAGHFVSQLAALILKRNKKTFINLKGIAMGNAYIDSNDNARGVYDYYWTHALISDEIHHGISKNCNFSSVATKACAHYTNKADEAVTNVFLYNIYASLCLSSSDDEILDMKKQDITPSVSKEYDPCSDDYVYAYLNKPEVQKALHANSTGINGPWYSCSDVVVYKPRDMRATVIPTIKRLMRSGIRVWIFSGDTDSVVPITATRYSLAKIRAPVKTPWYPWYNRGEVGGYAVGYENLTFASVRGAGHFVPSYQPERALTLISFFLQGKLPPRSEH